MGGQLQFDCLDHNYNALTANAIYYGFSYDCEDSNTVGLSLVEIQKTSQVPTSPSLPVPSIHWSPNLPRSPSSSPISPSLTLPVPSIPSSPSSSSSSNSSSPISPSHSLPVPNIPSTPSPNLPSSPSSSTISPSHSAIRRCHKY